MNAHRLQGAAWMLLLLVGWAAIFAPAGPEDTMLILVGDLLVVAASVGALAWLGADPRGKLKHQR